MRIKAEINPVKSWYNIVPNLGFTVAPPVTNSGFPLTQHDLKSISPEAVISQELDYTQGEIPIPAPVVDFYADWRPTPVFRADQFEKMLGTPAEIYYKYEGTSPSGGHEMNTAIAQVYYASHDKKVSSVISATGNGEWGAALAIACNRYGLKCKVFMVRSSYEQKVYGRYIMELLGAEVVPSPSDTTKTGKKALEQDAASKGSIGIALSEAFEEARSKEDTVFAWSSVMNHVLLHQTVIGLEAREQLKKIKVAPDTIISAVGGGSGFGGLVFPFFPERKSNTRMIAVETAVAPSLSRGRFAYDYSDTAGFAPLLKMYTLGHGYVPSGISAGDMRYHGMAPLVSALYREKKIETRVYIQREAFESAIAFARSEGRIPSPASAYTIKAVMDEALACKERKEKKSILFVLDANSNLDLASFKSFAEAAITQESEEAYREANIELPDIQPL